MVDGAEMQPVAFFTQTLYVPAGNPLNTPVRLEKFVPSMLKLLKNTVEVTRIVP
jgi:hypothetical protein